MNECWYWWPEQYRILQSGANEAILNAKDRLAGVKPEALRNLSHARLTTRPLKLSRATIPALPAEVPAPQIDGDLSDLAWKHAVHLPRFIRMKRMYSPNADSEAWVTYDADNLY